MATLSLYRTETLSLIQDSIVSKKVSYDNLSKKIVSLLEKILDLNPVRWESVQNAKEYCDLKLKCDTIQKSSNLLIQGIADQVKRYLDQGGNVALLRKTLGPTNREFDVLVWGEEPDPLEGFLMGLHGKSSPQELALRRSSI